MSLDGALAAVVLAGLALAAGLVLAALGNRWRRDEAALVACIDALLPQTQCGQCTYGGCLPYAAALARGDAGIDQCPPGGDAGAAALARLLGLPPRPVDPRFGITKPRRVAWIDEERCIGCAKCLPACPVDAIVGAQRFTHTVIAMQCTGCELCLPPCPVDCIELREPDLAAERGARRAA